MNIIKYHLLPPHQWYLHLQRSIPAIIREEEFTFDPVFGEGQFRYLQVQDGLWAQQLEFLLQHGLELQRVALDMNQYFLLDFYLSNSQMLVRSENKTYSQSFEQISLVLSSAMTAARIEIPAGQPMKIFNILFSREWLLKNVGGDHPQLHDFFSNDHPVYLAETLDHRLTTLAGKIDFNNNRLTSVSQVMQILDYLFSKFSNRRFSETPSKIHPKDQEQLMQVIQLLADDPFKKIPLSDLAERSGMSISKFKRLFRQVVGTTPYQYHLQSKMDKAMEILQSGQYSVSETGHMLDYSNLSQFSRAFKKHFGILPSEVGSGEL